MNFVDQIKLPKIVKIILIFSIFALQGCVAFAAAPLATTMLVGATATGAFGVYKSVQLTTGGSAEVRFKDVKLSESDQKALREIKRLAVMPGTGTNVKIAEKLMNKKYFTIITPSQVLKVVSADDKAALFASQATSHLTEAELIERLKDWATKLNADAILAYKEELDVSSDTTVWTFKRPEMKKRIAIKILSAKAGRFILNEPGEIVWEVGGKDPSQDEIQEIAAVSVVDKLMTHLKLQSQAPLS